MGCFLGLEDDYHDEGDVEEEDWIGYEVFLVLEADCLVFLVKNLVKFFWKKVDF